jgi:hypothetical protein
MYYDIPEDTCAEPWCASKKRFRIFVKHYVCCEIEGVET